MVDDGLCNTDDCPNEEDIAAGLQESDDESEEDTAEKRRPDFDDEVQLIDEEEDKRGEDSNKENVDNPQETDKGPDGNGQKRRSRLVLEKIRKKKMKIEKR
jgi:hypothetical protein